MLFQWRSHRLTAVCEVVVHISSHRSHLLCLLVFASTNHLSTGCADCGRAKPNHPPGRHTAFPSGSISAKAAGCFFHRRSCSASQNLSLRSWGFPCSCRSCPRLGADVRPTCFESTQNHSEHALLLVRILAPTADSGGANSFAQYKPPRDSIDEVNRVAMQIAARWPARSFARRPCRGDRCGNRDMAQFS